MLLETTQVTQRGRRARSRGDGIGAVVVRGGIDQVGFAAGRSERRSGRVEAEVFFLRELAIATVKVAYDVLTPTAYMRPAVIGIPLDVETDAEIATLAIVITLTPGTLALDVSSDRRTMYVHAMYVTDPEAIRREIKRGFERRVLELLR